MTTHREMNRARVARQRDAMIAYYRTPPASRIPRATRQEILQSVPVWRSLDERNNGLCYAARMADCMTWPEVAELAARLGMGTMTAVTIRKRIERYADDNGLRAPGRYHRPPVSKEGKVGHIPPKEGQEGKEGQQ